MPQWCLPSVDMAVLRFDDVERAHLCGLLEELGPDAPTLVSPWTAHDLAAHLVLRERDWLAAPGLVLPGGPRRFAERRQRALKKKGFPELVATFRAGPPPGFFRIGWVRRFPSLNEFYVHHEDLRRANGMGPRVLPPDEDLALFRNVVQADWFLSRRLRGVGLVIEWAGTERVVTARRGQPTARLSGSPGELLLFLFGRRHAADVDIAGSPKAIDALNRARFGM